MSQEVAGLFGSCLCVSLLVFLPCKIDLCTVVKYFFVVGEPALIRGTRGVAVILWHLMKAKDDLDAAIDSVELDGVLQDVEKCLLVQLPVGARPRGNPVCLDDLDFEVLVLERVVEGRQEVQYHQAQRWKPALAEGDHQLVVGNLGQTHLAIEHDSEHVSRSPDNPCIFVQQHCKHLVKSLL